METSLKELVKDKDLQNTVSKFLFCNLNSKYYNKLLLLFSSLMRDVRKIWKNKKITLLVSIREKNKYLFYSQNLDVINTEITKGGVNSFYAFMNDILYNPKTTDSNTFSLHSNSSVRKSIIVTSQYLTYTFTVEENSLTSVDNPYKGFYLWTYGVYGVNENLTIQTTKTTTAPYNLNLKESKISWYPEPPQVLDTYSNINNNFNFTIAFSGYMDPGTINDTFSAPTCLGQANGIYDIMIGDKYVCLGGGTLSWTADVISKDINAVNTNQFQKYQGICFDIEAGDSGLKDNFEQLFAAAKKMGLKTIVSVSHSAPYAFADANTLMQSFFQSMNIDYISTQLYTNDFGTANEYIENNSVTWDQFASYFSQRKNSNLQILPSIFSGQSIGGTYDLYTTGGSNNGLVPIDYTSPSFPIDTGSQNFFSLFNIETTGFIQWINGNISPA
jgi:hypothetical protein